MSRLKSNRARPIVVLGVLASVAFASPTLLPIGQARASDDGARFSVQDPLTSKECGDCHMAYPAGLLPKQSWTAIMNDLPNHFGEDASLDDASRARITAYLTKNAGRGNPKALRISQQRWFKSEHRKAATSKAFKKAKSWANCQACHSRAEQGDFED